MKKKSTDETPITKDVLNEALDTKLKEYATRTEMSIIFENYRSANKRDTEALLMQFRSDIFTRFDQIISELVQTREDQLFFHHDNKELKEKDKEHEKRITKLENQVMN